MGCNETNPSETWRLDELNANFTNKVLPVTVFVGLEIVIGFFGNLLILYVFIFRYHTCNFRTFVICLSFIDILCTFTTMPGEMVTQNFWYNYPFPYICKTKDFFNVFTVFAETLCLLVIAIDRYRKVCSPLEWQIKPKVAVIVCGVIIAIASIAAGPVLLFWGIMCKELPVQNVTITVIHCQKDEKYKNTSAPFVYEAIVGSFVFLFLVSMFVMYLRVAKTLIKERQNGVTHAPNALRIRKKTVIMIILTGCFMVTTIIYYVMICILGSGVDTFENLSSNNKVAFLFFLRFYFIQHIINPILYCAMDPTVKEALHSMKLSLINVIYRSRHYFDS